MDKKVSIRNKPALGKTNEVLFDEIRSLIEQTRLRVASTVNSALVLMNWHIGKRINDEILKNKRAESGNEIVSTLSRQLGWSHFKEIIYQKDQLSRDFYAEMCRIERWSVRNLRGKIQGMLFERTAISRKPEETIKNEIAELRDEDKLTPDLVFSDTYFLDFRGLSDTFSEKDLENAILRELERFLLELGVGFAFVARQKRFTVDGDDFHIDLLLYHRELRRLVVIELKLGKIYARRFRADGILSALAR